MPARYVVQTLDDMDWPENETPADVTAELALTAEFKDGPPEVRKVTVYLTRAHYDELVKDTARWFSAPEDARQRGRDQAGTAGSRTAVMEHRKRLREFADLFGVRNRRNSAVPAYQTATGKNERFPDWLEQEFEAWVEAGCPPPGQYREVA
jgi:hypothetical protein